MIMSARLSLLLALGCSLLALPAYAETIDCAQATTTPELNYCSEQDYRKSDAELNRIYDQALAALQARRDDGMTPEQRKNWVADLRTSQRAWVTFKEADCNQLTGWEWFGGTGAVSASWNCLAAKTQARSEELKDRYGVQ
jgi:uncharacterized protein YecT (DUF1311 family)